MRQRMVSAMAQCAEAKSSSWFPPSPRACYLRPLISPLLYTPLHLPTLLPRTDWLPTLTSLTRLLAQNLGGNASPLGRQCVVVWKSFPDGAQRTVHLISASLLLTDLYCFSCRTLKRFRGPKLWLYNSASDPPPPDYPIVQNRWLRRCDKEFILRKKMKLGISALQKYSWLSCTKVWEDLMNYTSLVGMRQATNWVASFLYEAQQIWICS